MAPLRTCECGECPKCKHRAYMNEYYRRPGVADRARERVREYNKSHPDKRPFRRPAEEKLKAHNEVNRAVRRGDLERQPCEECGDAEVHAHHDDYAKPLEVRWLCRRHHGEAHRRVA